jgi:hypothetical protein
MIVALVVAWAIDHSREESEKSAIRLRLEKEAIKLRAELKFASERISSQDKIIATQGQMLHEAGLISGVPNVSAPAPNPPKP